MRTIFEMLFGSPEVTLSARLILAGTDMLTKDRLNDPVYKANVQKLIERSRKFEEARE